MHSKQIEFLSNAPDVESDNKAFHYVVGKIGYSLPTTLRLELDVRYKFQTIRIVWIVMCSLLAALKWHNGSSMTTCFPIIQLWKKMCWSVGNSLNYYRFAWYEIQVDTQNDLLVQLENWEVVIEFFLHSSNDLDCARYNRINMVIFLQFYRI